MNAVKVYVGTYGKYSGGSIAGEWLDLADYSSVEEFEEKAREIHSDEADPEFMIQDREGWPFSESYTVAEFRRFYELSDELDDEEELELFRLFAENYSPTNWASVDVDTFRDAYAGTYDSERDYSDEQADELIASYAGEIPQALVNYFDYEAFHRDVFISDAYSVETEDGRKAIFRNI